MRTSTEKREVQALRHITEIPHRRVAEFSSEERKLIDEERNKSEQDTLWLSPDNNDWLVARKCGQA
ncbi:CLUMA_CG005268, isoform A [Clunio marinus]|uniref:CLUMA_CG005268, isoform A n=1 Tax=Clunio marinus TaxID=568069 RepID=A0A1J1HYJ9_9DIPT|nr:CLUMA_CG005268, isoform A [Clunio marinus]